MEQELQKEQKCSFYALEQLRQTAEAILRGSQRLLKCRAGVEKYRTAQPQRAYAYYLELQKTRDALLVALGDAQRNLLELEESALAGKAGQLQAGLHRFDLMSRAYKPVYEVLTGFAKSLPQADTVNAAVIGRLMNHVRMGYYPTDPENITHILRGIAFPEGVTTNLLDPCCGCGKALRQLADGNNCYTYGMELDEHRAEEAQTRLHRVGFGSFFHSQISREAFHVLFLNPPYLSVLAEGGSRVRSEKQFLVQSIRTLMLGGLLIYIVPYYGRTGREAARISREAGCPVVRGLPAKIHGPAGRGYGKGAGAGEEVSAERRAFEAVSAGYKLPGLPPRPLTAGISGVPGSFTKGNGADRCRRHTAERSDRGASGDGAEKSKYVRAVQSRRY